MSLQQISDIIETRPNYPKGEIIFRDINPLLKNDELRELAFDMMAELVKKEKIVHVAGIESRGYVFGIPLAQRLKCGFVMIKKEKIHHSTGTLDDSSYQSTHLKIPENIINIGDNVLVVDDILATGSSLLAGCELIQKIGGNVVGCSCLIELFDMVRNNKLEKYKIFSLIKYPANRVDKFISHTDEMLFQKPVEYIPLDNLSELDDRIIVFSHPTMKSMAENIICLNKNFRSGTIIWNHFPDGYPDIKFEHLSYLENKRVVFIGSLYDQKYLLEQLSMIMILPRQYIKSLDIIFPYFAPATVERVDEGGIVGTAETTAKILTSCLPVTKCGLPVIHVFDLHSPTVRFYFPDTVTIRIQSAIPLLKQKITKNTTIVFPDEGAYKRFKIMFSDYRTIVCSKDVDDNRIINITNKLNWPLDDAKCLDDVLIVDDLVHSGKTFEECRKALINYGAKKISAYVTHAPFPNRGYMKFLNSGFHKFYITNSIPEIANILEHKAPFEIIKLDGLIVDTLLKSYEIPKPMYEKREVFKIFVGSTNNMKLSSAYGALNKVLLNHGKTNFKITVHGIAVPSEVSEQPINEETKMGCENRMKNLIKYVNHHHYTYDYLICIENGVNDKIVIEDDVEKVYDYCDVLIHTQNASYFASSDDKTFFPKKFLTQSINTNKKVTCADFIEKEYGIKKGMWYKHFGSVTRIEMMTTALLKAFDTIKY